MQTTKEIIQKLPVSAEIDSPLKVAEPKPPLGPTCVDFGIGPEVAADPTFRARWLGTDERCHTEVTVMREETELWLKRCLTNKPEDKLLVLAGKVGTGKSFIARRAIRAIRLMSISAWYEGLRPAPVSAGKFHWSSLSAIPASERNEKSRWIDAIETEAALVDDIGTETDQFRSGLPTENLRWLLEARRNLWTIITTNVPPATWSECWDVRVADRLRRNSVIVTLHSALRFTK